MLALLVVLFLIVYVIGFIYLGEKAHQWNEEEHSRNKGRAMCMTGLSEDEDARLRYLLGKRIGTMTEEELNEAKSLHAQNVGAFEKKYST